ncbi:hypothetical protein [Flexivirga sp. B27]
MPPEHIDVLGSVISVDIPPADSDRIRAQWSRCMAQPDRTPVTSVVYGSQDDADRRDYGLASALTLAGITQAAGTRLMLHAAGVADPGTGRVAVLVAASGTGKTTAARRLCTAGFGYVTDETVSIGTDDDVLAYPKPLSVVIAGDSPHHKSQHGPDELGLPPCPADPRAALFVLLDRDGDDPGATPSLDRVPLLDGLISLIPQTSALPAMPRPLQTLAGAVRRAGGVWRLRYHDVEDATDLLRDAVLADPVEPSDVTAFPAPVDRSSRPHPADEAASEETAPDDHEPQVADDSRVVRAPYLDAIGVDAEVLVLIDTRPVRLSGLGATIWTGSAQATSVAELTARCVAEHGEHPQAGDLVRDAVRELLRHDALQLTRTT